MEGSTYKVAYTKILEIMPHDNADRLEVARIYGFNVIISKNSLKVGDAVFYVPIDSVLPEDLEEIVFANSKVKLNKRRVKQIRIRKYPSQGLILSIEHVNKLMEKRGIKSPGFKLEQDYAKLLEVKKYEPPAPTFQQFNGKSNKLTHNNPHFKKYGGIDNFKWYPNLFSEDDEVVVTEKIHGTHVRFGWAPFVANTFWKKIKKFFKLAPKWEWVYGSNNVQLQNKLIKKNYYGDDVYGKCLAKYDAKNKVPKGVIVHGEIYGDGIQKNYKYGCKSGEHKLIIFDVKKLDENGEYRFSDFYDMYKFGKKKGFDVVPVLYRGKYDFEEIKKLTLGDSVLVPEQKVREGVVIKPVQETSCAKGRKILKLISEKYLDKDQSDFH